MRKKARNRKYLALVSFHLVFLTRLSGAAEVARVNQTSITLEELDRAYQGMVAISPLNPPTKNQVLDNLIQRELGLQEAKRLHLDKTPEFQYRVDGLLYQSLIEKTLRDTKVNLSDKQLEEHYKKNPYIKTSYIFVAASPEATQAERDKAYARIQRVEEKLKLKMPFDEVARNFSEAANSIQGGELDYQSRAQLEAFEPTYYDATLKLSEGKPSGILQGKLGYYIIQRNATRKWSQIDKATFKQVLTEEKRKSLFQKDLNALLEKLKKKAKITIHSELIHD